jgi:hypothetical protein
VAATRAAAMSPSFQQPAPLPNTGVSGEAFAEWLRAAAPETYED